MLGIGVLALGLRRRCYTPCMAEGNVKQEILKAIERLPDDATMEDVTHLVRMHERLARARRDSAAGLGITTDQLRAELGLNR